MNPAALAGMEDTSEGIPGKEETMADMNVKLDPAMAQIQSIQPSKSQPAQRGQGTQEAEQVRAGEAEREVEEVRREAEELAAKPERELENVVAVSEDGDTVQVSEEGNEKLEDQARGSVKRLDQQEEPQAAQVLEEQARAAREMREAIQAAREARAQSREESREQAGEEQAREEETREITSFAGYTNTQLERLYRDGAISRHDYEQEMEAREDDQAATMEEGRELDRQMGQIASARQQVQADEETVETLASGESSDSIDVQIRAQMLANLQDFPFSDQG